MDIKMCEACGDSLPATAEFFTTKGHGEGQILGYACRDCRSIYSKILRCGDYRFEYLGRRVQGRRIDWPLVYELAAKYHIYPGPAKWE